MYYNNQGCLNAESDRTLLIIVGRKLKRSNTGRVEEADTIQHYVAKLSCVAGVVAQPELAIISCVLPSLQSRTERLPCDVDAASPPAPPPRPPCFSGTMRP